MTAQRGASVNFPSLNGGGGGGGGVQGEPAIKLLFRWQRLCSVDCTRLYVKDVHFKLGDGSLEGGAVSATARKVQLCHAVTCWKSMQFTSTESSLCCIHVYKH